MTNKRMLAFALIGIGAYLVWKAKNQPATAGVVAGDQFLPFNLGWVPIGAGAFLLMK